MKTKFVILLCIFLNVAFGQLHSSKDKDNKFCLKITPLPLFDVWGGHSYRIGSEFKIYRNIATSVELGKYFGFKGGPILISTKGDIIKVEIKYYTDDNENAVGRYNSIEYMHKNITFNKKDSVRIKPNPTFEKQYTITRELSCITFKTGELDKFDDFLLEWYVGAGLRFCTCAHNSLTSDEQAGLLTGEYHGNLIGELERTSHPYWVPYITAGFKIGLGLL